VNGGSVRLRPATARQGTAGGASSESNFVELLLGALRVPDVGAVFIQLCFHGLPGRIKRQ